MNRETMLETKDLDGKRRAEYAKLSTASDGCGLLLAMPDGIPNVETKAVSTLHEIMEASSIIYIIIIATI